MRSYFLLAVRSRCVLARASARHTFGPPSMSGEKAAPEVGTVVVSCSALILESKQIVADEEVHKKLHCM